MNDTIKRRKTVFLPVMVSILTAAVLAQSVLIYTLFKRSGCRSEEVTDDNNLRSRSSPSAVSAVPAQPRSFESFGFLREDWPPLNGRNDWNPFADLKRFRQQIDRLFDDTFTTLRQGMASFDQAFGPELDLLDDGDNYVVKFSIPGTDKASVSVRIDDRVLTIAGEMEASTDEKSGRAYRIERRSGRFERSITMPGPVDGQRMTTEYVDGVLTVVVPKQPAQSVTRSITM